MINGHFGLKTCDISKFKEIKKGAVYGSYVKSVLESPLFSSIKLEHIKDIDITEEIVKLREDKATSSDYNKVFKNAMVEVANRIVADTIILKELTELSIEDVKEGLEDDFIIKYLMGLSDKVNYDKARKILKDNPNTGSVLYIGLAEYDKKYTKNDKSIRVLNDSLVAKKEVQKTRKKELVKSINIDGSTLDFSKR